MENMLYYGDNLKVLRNDIKDDSVELIYLDPPFNSNRDYNQIFTSGGKKSEAQLIVFEDTWFWDPDVEKLYFQTVKYSGNDQVSRLLIAMRDLLGISNMMAYLTMMAPRLIELRRILKRTGSIFLHCDPTSSHYLKLLMDAVFGANCFRNEIVWRYSGWNAKLKDSFNSRHDILLFYGCGPNQTFNSFSLPWQSEGEYISVRKQKLYIDEHGEKYVLSDAGGGKRAKRYLSDAMVYGKPIDDVWDIPKINNSSKERLGYPTQKPVALLERIISAASNPGDIVLDPFCGCGTAIIAAERLDRKWIGIDVTHIAITIIKERLHKEFGLLLTPNKVTGEPYDIDGAIDLASRDRYQFQIWALSLLGIKNSMKKGADGGIDGIHYFEGGFGQIKKCIAQVKSGKVSVRDIRELHGVVEREKAELGLLMTLNPPTKNMIQEAASFGIYESSNGKQYPVIQIIEVSELLNHSKFLHTLLPE